MATDERSDAELLADFDAEMALLRAELEPEDLSEFDLDTALARAELEEELLAIEAEGEEEPAAFGACGCTIDDDDIVRCPVIDFETGAFVNGDGPVNFSGEGSAMYYGDESDEQYARRVNAKAFGRDARQRPANGKTYQSAPSVPGGPAEFSSTQMSTMTTYDETPEAYARRVNQKVLGRDVRHGAAEFSSTAMAPAAAAPAMPFYVPLPPPIDPTDEQESAFLARLASACDGPSAAADRIRAELRALQLQAAQLARTVARWYNPDWVSTVRPFAGRIALLEAMARALDASAASGNPVEFASPTPDQAAEAAGRLIAALAPNHGVTVSQLLQGVRVKALGLELTEARVGREVSQLFGGSPVGDVEGLHESYHRTTAGLADDDEELRILNLLADYPAALGRIVAKVLEEAGGRESVLADLTALNLVAATGPDRDEQELASITSKLKALGPDSAGRAAQGLQTRCDELTATLERRRAEARDEAASKADEALSSALAGDAEAVQALATTVRKAADAFSEGLGIALDSAPREALQETGYGGLSGISI